MKTFQHHISKKGMSLIEIIIAVAIFALISAAIASLSLSGMNGLVESADMARAEGLAQEGVEAVKSVRDNAWNVISGTSVVATSTGNAWALNSGVSETIDKFTRTITLGDVCRTIATNTATTTCSGSSVYLDVQSKKVTVTVTWAVREGVNNSVQKVLYVTNWNSHDWTQTDWSGGTGQTIWSDATKYSLGTNVDHTSAGNLKLALAPDGSWINAGGTLITHTTDTDFNAGTYSTTTVMGTGSNASVILTEAPQWAAHIDSGVATTQDLHSIVMSSSTSGWAVGGSGKILNYNGTNWTEFVDLGGNDVNAISRITSSNIWATGQSGKIWNYNGTSWSENFDTGNETFNAMDMLSASAGWVVGNGGAVTQYNGTTWTETTVPSSANIQGVDALSTTDVWASGASGRFWHYNGTSWSLHTDTGGEQWNAIAAVSASSIWAVGSGGAIRYYNGTTWSATTSPTTQDLYSLNIISASDIWAAGQSGTIVHYNGTSWSLQTDTGSNSWRAIAMMSTTTGFVVGLSGEIFEYGNVYNPSGTFTSSVIDGGVGSNNWASVFWTEILPAGGDVTIATRSGNTATPDGTWSGWSAELTTETGSTITSGNSRYIQYRVTFTRPTDTKQTSQLDDITIIYNTPTSQDLKSVDPVTASDIWAAGNNGVLLHYNGTSWTSISSPVTNNLLGIDMVSAADGWAVGASGKFLHYDGTSWSEFLDTGSEMWNTVSMASSTFGFAGGSSASNMASYNGTTWTKFTGPVTQAINDIFMFSNGTGWAVGDSGKILYYNGTSWGEFTDTGTQNILGIHMVSTTDGWAVGNSGKIWRYNGTSWSEFTDTGGDTWNAVALASTNKGWAFGDANNALKWNGASWASETIPTTQTIYGVKAITTINAWAVGANGTILHFDQSALYQRNGVATSSAFDTTNASSSIQAIEWDQDLATSTCSACSIKFQVRGAATSGAISSAGWIGPDGTASTYFSTSTGSIIPSSLNNNRWVQYKTNLVGDGTSTPLLQEVKINYR